MRKCFMIIKNVLTTLFINDLTGKKYLTYFFRDIPDKSFYRKTLETPMRPWLKYIHVCREP